MTTNKPPDDTEAAEHSPSSPKPAPTAQAPKMIFTLFPRDATSKQIADALNELRRQHARNQ